MRRPLMAFILLALVAAPGMARAQVDVVGARALGMGEAMRATATGAEAPLLNPAGMSLVRQYVIEGMYGYSFEDTGSRANVTIVDSVTSRVAAGLFYDFIYTQPRVGFNWAGGRVDSAQLTRTGHVAGLSLSLPLGGSFILGATVKYLHMSTTAPLPTGTMPPNLTLDSASGVTFDFGAILRLGRFNVGVVGYNLWDHGSQETPLSLGVGLAYVPAQTVSINFDTDINFTGFKSLSVDPMGKTELGNRTTVRLGPGIEVLAANHVPVRAGVVYDTSLPATYITAGLGYVGSSFGADLGYRGKVDGGKENILMLGLRLFIQ